MTAIPRRLAVVGSLCATSEPFIFIQPVSGRWAPVMTFTNVDLPAPFSPISACTSPGRSLNDTPLSACTPAKDFVMPVNSRSALTRVPSPATISALRQDVPLVRLDLVQPRRADGDVLPETVIIPNRPER